MLLPRRRIQYTDNIHVFDINIVYHHTPNIYLIIDSITITDHSDIITDNFDIFIDAPDFYFHLPNEDYDFDLVPAEFNMTKNDNVFYWKNANIKEFSIDDYNNIDTRGVPVTHVIYKPNSDLGSERNICGVVKSDFEYVKDTIKYTILGIIGLHPDSCHFQIETENYSGIDSYCLITNEFYVGYEEDYAEGDLCTFDYSYLYENQLRFEYRYRYYDYDYNECYGTNSGSTNYGSFRTSLEMVPNGASKDGYFRVYENGIEINDFVDRESFIYVFLG